jgi:hypothetical protein
VSSFEILLVKSLLSPKGTPDLEALALTTITRENTPVTLINLKDKPKGKTKSKAKDNAIAKKARQAEFKNNWYEEMSIDSKKITNVDCGSFIALFKVY